MAARISRTARQNERASLWACPFSFPGHPWAAPCRPAMVTRKIPASAPRANGGGMAGHLAAHALYLSRTRAWSPFRKSIPQVGVGFPYIVSIDTFSPFLLSAGLVRRRGAGPVSFCHSQPPPSRFRPIRTTGLGLALSPDPLSKLGSILSVPFRRALS